MYCRNKFKIINLSTQFCDPHLSRIKKIIGKNCPKFLIHEYIPDVAKLRPLQQNFKDVQHIFWIKFEIKSLLIEVFWS